MDDVITRVGRCTLAPRTEWTHFDALVRSIVYQQLSGKAAATIHGRVLTLIGDGDEAPQRIVATSHESLRGAGLSTQKANYIRNLAEHVLDGSLPINSLHELSDDEIIAALTQVKGIGPWSAQMFLMFRLGRPDILPELDLGVQKGIQKAYRMRKLPSPKQVLLRGKEMGSLQNRRFLVHVENPSGRVIYLPVLFPFFFLSLSPPPHSIMPITDFASGLPTPPPASGFMAPRRQSVPDAFTKAACCCRSLSRRLEGAWCSAFLLSRLARRPVPHDRR